MAIKTLWDRNMKQPGEAAPGETAIYWDEDREQLILKDGDLEVTLTAEFLVDAVMAGYLDQMT